jgi:hypothetical protein
MTNIVNRKQKSRILVKMLKKQINLISLIAITNRLPTWVTVNLICQYSKKWIKEKKPMQLVGVRDHQCRLFQYAVKFAVTYALPIGISALFGTFNISYSQIYHNLQVEAAVTGTINEPLTLESQPADTGHHKPYAIIVGAFKSLEKAEDLVLYLNARGNNADIEGKSTTGLFRVSIRSYYHKDEANRQLTIIRSNMYPSAWLLVKDETFFKVTPVTKNLAQGTLVQPNRVTFTSPPDSVISKSQMPVINNNILFSQYYKLGEILKQYREIEKNGRWNPIDIDPEMKSYKPGDTANAIHQIRERLYTTGDLKQNNESCCYDPDLAEAVRKYKIRNALHPSELILPVDILEMNVPIGELIKKIIRNMERYRSIYPEFAEAKKFIMVNIPAFDLHFIRNGKTELQSPVIVGEYVSKTLIFSSMLSSIEFNPYWNVPQSIIDKEIRPGMAKNKNFLKDHNMEWDQGQLRQKPGKGNSLGLVKFIFPNSENIYMHDTPVKSLFEKENRAFSHGCIRVGKSRELAIAILKDDGWMPEQIDRAMNSGKESIHVLKNKIPIHIGYFTAWVDDEGMLYFYDDIYHLDFSPVE